MGLSIGVAGVGRLGRVHVRVLSEMEGVDAVACHDTQPDRAAAAAAEHGARAFDDLGAMIDAVDAVCVVVPTTHHAEVALEVFRRGKDVFVEKPLARSAEESQQMVDGAREAGCILQVGHVERFNGVIQAVAPIVEDPSFIEVHRLAPFTVRGTDVSVVGDLMIHDLDLLSYLTGEWPVDIRAKGAAILTDGPDIVNARLEYPSGCVANVTASRVTASPMRKIRIFSTSTGYISIDLLKGVASHVRKAPSFDESIAALREKSDGHEQLGLANFVEQEFIRSDGGEPLAKELAAFCHTLTTREAPQVTGEDGLNAVKLATEILSQIS